MEDFGRCLSPSLSRRRRLSSSSALRALTLLCVRARSGGFSKRCHHEPRQLGSADEPLPAMAARPLLGLELEPFTAMDGSNKNAYTQR